jgi:glycosyltransferase involved in cell wall biosynthesis
MRILVLHSRYASGNLSGENRVVESEIGLLADAGHDVRAWTPEAPATDGLGLLATGAGAIHSTSAVRRVRRLLREHGSDVVHCHNLFPSLSPSVLRAAADEGAAVVMTLHNYRLLCLPATFLRDGHVCEDCLRRVPWRGVVHRCYRGSVLGSGALAGSLTLHRAAGTLGRVRRFLAVSQFLREKHVEAGLPAERIAVKPNFVPSAAARRGAGRHFLYLGRLSPEKGVATLLEAHRPEHGPLVLAGDGPDRQRLQTLAGPGVELTGAVPPDAVSSLLADARALLVPSTSYEGAPRGVLEAYAVGVPVVASRIGSLTELVDDRATGLLVPPEDPRAWADALTRLADDDDESRRLGAAARRLWAARYSPERAVADLERAYRSALETSSTNETRQDGQ